MLGGTSGSGKTTLVLQCIKKMQDREPNWLGLHGRRVAWISADRPDALTREKSNEIGIKIIEYYCLFEPKFYNNPAKLIHLVQQSPATLFNHCILQFKQPYDLLIVDTIGAFQVGDLNDYKSVISTLFPMSCLAVKERVAVLNITHSPKGQGGSSQYGYKRPQDWILGSNAFQGYSDTLHVLMDQPDSPMIKLWSRSHDSPASTLQLVRKGPWLSDDPMDFPTGYAENEEVKSSKQAAVQYLMETVPCRKTKAYDILKELEGSSAAKSSKSNKKK